MLSLNFHFMFIFCFSEIGNERNGGIPVSGDDKEGGDFPITTIMIVVFIVLICCTLLLLYFFYKYLIYVVIGLFAIASVTGTYTCLSGLMSFIKCGMLSFGFCFYFCVSNLLLVLYFLILYKEIW